MSKRIGKQVDFSTLALYDNIENKFINNLKPLQDLFETTKIIYALCSLYDDDKEKILQTINSITNDIQRSNTIVIAKAYFKVYEDIFDIFNSDTEI